MKGLELSRQYFRQYGLPMLRERFPEILSRSACGLTGPGSECYGYDDELSQDHDFEPGFCLFVPDDTDEKTLFQLERAYSQLPNEFEGHKRKPMSPVGGNRHGVFRIGDWLQERVGSQDGSLSDEQWLKLPQYVLAEAVNGEIFLDEGNLITPVRYYLAHMPLDIKRKRLAGNLLLMAQSGQYNYLRCLKHGESAAAQLAVNEFVRAALEVIFLLNDRYLPYYKWSFRALRHLPELGFLADSLEYLLTTPNDEETASRKQEVIESIALLTADQLRRQQFTALEVSDLERLAYSVNDCITDGIIRNLHILYTAD